MERKGFLGGSDCAAIMGMSRWSTPLQVWAEKTGQIVRPEIDSEACELGKELEDYVARRFTRKTGIEVEMLLDDKGRRLRHSHKKYPYISCEIDRRVKDKKIIMECKTASAWKSKEWQGEEIPVEYILQCQHMMLVTDAPSCWIACLIGNQSFVYREIPRDDKLIEVILDKEVDFWENYVLTGIMPVNVNHKDIDTLDELWQGKTTEEAILLGDDVNMLIESRQGLLADVKSVQAGIDDIEAQIKAHLKEHSQGTTSHYVINWKEQISKRLDTKRIKAEKPEIYTEYAKDSICRKMTIKSIKEGAVNE